jgi:nucleoside-specific outer membrane channel protein Tsx
MALAGPLSAFESTNIQWLYSNDFDGNSFIYDTVDGKKSTVTVEHFRTWSYGDLFMFVDFTDGTQFDGGKQQLYGEVAPRLSLGKAANSDLSFGIVTDLYAAAQLNRGEDYNAWLVGAGVDLALGGFDFCNANLYHKNQNIGSDTWQLSLAYRTNAFFGWHVDGFADITDYEVNTQNQLLYNLGRHFMKGDEKLFAGTEWLYYRDSDANVDTSVFQAMVKYRF